MGRAAGEPHGVWIGQKAEKAPTAASNEPEGPDTPGEGSEPLVTPSRPSWQAWALELAKTVATRADCTRRQVGAVILDATNHVVSTGYNGYPAGRPGCLTASACPRGQMTYEQIPKDSAYVGTQTPCAALHAEENAILHAYRDLTNCTLYVTHEPCPNCRRLLDGTNLTYVVWPEGMLWLGQNAYMND